MAFTEYIFNSKTAAFGGAALLAIAPGAFHALPQTIIVATVSSIKVTGKTLKSETANGQWLFLNLVIACRADAAKACSSGMRKIRFPAMGDVVKFVGPESIKSQKDSLLEKLDEPDIQKRIIYELELPFALKGQEAISITVPINGIVNAKQDINIVDETSKSLLTTNFDCKDLPLNSTEVREISKNSCEERFSIFDRLVFVIPGFR
jgi:hypothetical protein